jgi:hypothetical protein
MPSQPPLQLPLRPLPPSRVTLRHVPLPPPRVTLVNKSAMKLPLLLPLPLPLCPLLMPLPMRPQP